MKIRHLLLVAIMALTTVATAVAQAPLSFTYQAVVRNSSGRLVSNATVGVKISIVRDSATGRVVYSGVQTPRTNANGLFTLVIGDSQNGIDTITWRNGPYFLKSEVDPNGGTNYTLTSVQQMLSVPYALHAHTVDSIIGGVNFIERQVLSMNGDTVFLTGGSYVVLPPSFSGNYNDLTNKPTIPTNVSAFYNDAGYLTSATLTETQVLSIRHDTVFLTGGSFVKLPAGFSGNYNDLTNKPTNVSAFYNDAGYLTSATLTETQVLSMRHDTVFLTGGSFVKLPAGFSGNYNDLTNKPTIPTVPTNVSAFTNDAGYLTNATLTETQVLSISHDTVFLTGGSFVKLPAGFSGNYNDLTNKPTIPTVPTNVSAFTNDAGYLTSFTETQVLSIRHDTVFLTGGSFVVLPSERQNLSDVATNNDSVNSQIKNLYDPTDSLDAVNLRTLNAVISRLDSIITYQNRVIDTLNRRIGTLGATTGDTTAVVCERFNWYGTEYTTSGDFQHVLQNAAGFDSVITLHLTINNGTFNSESQTVCESYMWHGNNYTANGTYTYTYSNASGCPSIDTLRLTINSSTHNVETADTCNSYTWHGTTYTTSGKYTYSYNNATGCSSVDTLNLTIKYSTHQSVIQTTTSNYTWHDSTYTTSGNYTYSYINTAGCPSVDTLHLNYGGFDVNGASRALFSVSVTKKVRFSKGNLQWSATGGGSQTTTHAVAGGGTARGTWRFAEHQWDYLLTINNNISSTYTGWIDLFGWGTSGWNSGATAYQPWATSTTASQYCPGGNSDNDLTGSYSKSDWGIYNAISNGGNVAGMWRVLTKDEWNYLFNNRSATMRYVKATVNSKQGVILFPDYYSHPSSIPFPSNLNNGSALYSVNTYNSTQWQLMENSGCVFFPITGDRTGTSTIGTVWGFYWSSTHKDAARVYYMGFSDESFSAVGGTRQRYYGHAIRLVMDAQ